MILSKQRSGGFYPLDIGETAQDMKIVVMEVQETADRVAKLFKKLITEIVVSM